VRKSLWLTVAAFIGLVFVVIFAIWSLSNKGDVSIANQAAEPIRDGIIEVCKQRFEFGEIKPNESKQIHYKVKSDSDYDVTIEFASGKKLTRRLGYVTSGMDFHDTLTVRNDDIALGSR